MSRNHTRDLYGIVRLEAVENRDMRSYKTHADRRHLARLMASSSSLQVAQAFPTSRHLAETSLGSCEIRACD